MRSTAVAAAAALLLSGSALAWTDDPLRPGATPLKAAHILEIRAAIDAKRSDCRFSAHAWTADVAPGRPTRGDAVNELREQANQLLADLGQSTASWTAPATLGSGTPTRAVFITEVRAAVDRAGAVACPPPPLECLPPDALHEIDQNCDGREIELFIDPKPCCSGNQHPTGCCGVGCCDAVCRHLCD